MNGLSALFGNQYSLLRCLAKYSSQILTAYQTYLDGLMDQAQMPICSCMNLSFVPKCISRLLTNLGFNGTYPFICSMHHLGCDGCIRCHPHNIIYTNNTLLCFQACLHPQVRVCITRVIPQFLHRLCKMCPKRDTCTLLSIQCSYFYGQLISITPKLQT